MEIERSCTLCLLTEKEVGPWLKTLEQEEVGVRLESVPGFLRIVLRSTHDVDDLIEKVRRQFPTFFLGEKSVEEALHFEMIARKKTLGLAESCTGGLIAARLVEIPNASLFLLGSIVAYSNAWKERFLAVRHDTLKTKGAVSPEVVEEMVHGIFAETECDYAIAVSGMLAPDGHLVYVGIGKRGEVVDMGRIVVPDDRLLGMELAARTALGALWRRLVHNTVTFQ